VRYPHVGKILGAFAFALGAFYAAVIWAVVAPPPHSIMAPDSVQSGAQFVASWDQAGCANKPAVVTWTVPPGCVIVGQGNPNVRLTCTGSRGTILPLTATATAGRPPASCNGSAETSVVIAGGDADLPCCPISTGDGADPHPVDSVAPTTYYYRPGVQSTGRLELKVAISACRECPK
jgi:hypothetical protein